MSGIFDQVINYSPPSLLTGTVTYKGTWSAATNTPTLVNPPDVSTNGHYYVVSAAGTQFSLSFNIGDWIISNGSAWQKVDNTDAVDSVFGRTGAVVGVSTDYSSAGITNTALGASNPSTVAATTITASSTIAATGAVTGSNLSGTNTGDQTITLTGGVTGSGAGSFAATVVTNANLTGGVTSVGNAATVITNANLTGDITSSGNATTLTNAPVIAKVITGYVSGAGTVAATDSILQAIQKLNGNDATNANLTGVITSVGNATSIASQTGTGTKFVVDTSPILVTPNIGTPSAGTVTNLTGTASININGTVGATTPAAGSFTTLAAGVARMGTGVANFAEFSDSTRFGASDTYSFLSQSGGASTYVNASTGGNVSLRIANADKAVVSSTGLAVTGTVTSTGKVFANGAGDLGGVLGAYFGASGNGLDILNSTDTSAASFANWRNSSGGVIGNITRVTTTNAVTYNTTSDARLKENFRDFTDSGRLIDALKPRVFDWKDTDGNGKDAIGFIAQEEHAADPVFAHIGAVSVGDDHPTTITEQWQRSDAALIPILVAELQSLRKRLAALESK